MTVIKRNNSTNKGKTLKSSLLGHYRGSKLDNEILDFVQEINVIRKKQRPIEISIIAKVEHLVKAIWINSEIKVGQGICNVEVKLYGSRKTGLSLDNSDLDIVICFLDGYNNIVPIKIKWRNDAIRILGKELQSAQNTWANNVDTITNCKVPIIKFESESMQVDVSFACPIHSGLKVTQGVLQYLKEYDHLKPLVIILKKLKHSCDLPAPHDGGFGTYTLTMMVVSFLQIRKYSEPMNIGEALINFVYFYGHSFDFVKEALRPNKPYLRVNPRTVCEPSMRTDPFLLFDPFKKTNNLGHSVRDIQQIKGPFRGFLNRLDTCLGYWHENVVQRVLTHALNTHFKECLPSVETLRNPKSRPLRKKMLHAYSSPSLSSLSCGLLPTPSFTDEQTIHWKNACKQPYHTNFSPWSHFPITSHSQSHTSSRTHSRSQSVSPQQYRRTFKNQSRIASRSSRSHTSSRSQSWSPQPKIVRDNQRISRSVPVSPQQYHRTFKNQSRIASRSSFPFY